MKLFNLQRHNPDADHETGAHCCYHCGKAKHQDGSVFCPECFPEPGSLPALIDERTKQEPRRRVAELFALFLRPVRHANNLRLRLLACQDDKRDLEQANLALRRKCADLRAQRDSALGLLDEALTDKAALQKLLAEAERDRDCYIAELAYIEERFQARKKESTEAETSPDGEAPAEVLAYVWSCAKNWEPNARIIGNARAGDIARAIACVLPVILPRETEASQN